MTNNKELYIGLMSGTSADGIDCSLMSIEQDKISIILSQTIGYESELQNHIKQLMQSGQCSLEALGKMDKSIAINYANAVKALLKDSKVDACNICAIGSHGQTIRHSPPNISGELAFSMQLGDPSTLAKLTGINVVADFRQADMANGGQGAPLAPGFHQHLFKQHMPCAVLNLGGIANISLINHAALIAYDTGPASTLLDGWISRVKGQNFDCNGDWAKTGTIQDKLLYELLNEPYFKRKAPKSTGFELFNQDWLDKKLKIVSANYKPEDIQATLTELTAQTVADCINNQDIEKLYVCGGGYHNSYLMHRLRELSQIDILSTADIGVDPDYVEAIAFAWLAYCNIHNIPANVPSVTGASKATILGGLYKHS